MDKKELAASGFSNGAQYNGARPGYPQAALDYFVSTLHLTRSSSVLDLGAGTGIFTRQIAPLVGAVTAVDPSASMRASFEEASPNISMLEGSDIAIPLADACVDVVFVAQAFHWFDVAPALQEIHRVLVPNGSLGLIWNERDESVGWVHELSRAMEWDVKQPYAVGSDFTEAIASGPFVDIHHVQFSNPIEMSHDGLYQRVLSTSYIAIMNTDDQAALLSRVKKVVDSLPNPLVLPHITDVYTATAQ